MKEHYLVVKNSNSWIHMVPKKSLLIESLEAVVRFFLIFTPVLLLLYGQGDIRNILIGFLMLPFQLAIVVLKHKTKNGFKFLIYNSLLIFSIYLIFPSLAEKIIYAIIQLITVIYYATKLKAKPTGYMNFTTLFFSSILYIVYFILASSIKLPRAVDIVTIAAIINVISILVNIQIVNRNAVLAWGDKDSAKISEGMNKTSGAIVFIVIISILLLNAILWLTGAFEAADGLLSNIQFKEVKLQQGNDIPIPGKKYPQDQIVQTPQMIEPLLESDKKTIKPLIYLGYILKVGIMIIVALVVIYILYALAVGGKDALKRLLGFKNTKEKRESILKESDALTIVPNVINKIKYNLKESVNLSNNMKIRRTYKKLVKSYKKSGVKPQKHQTATSISKKIEVVSSKDYSKITNLYHKARYGANQCSEEEVKLAKENM